MERRFAENAAIPTLSTLASLRVDSTRAPPSIPTVG
jgi:hypothetical protein